MCVCSIRNGLNKSIHTGYILLRTHWGVLSSLSFIERIPQCIELYLANQGGMGDDLSHSPCVSGNLRPRHRQNCQTQDPEYLGWLDSPWRVVAEVGRAECSHLPTAGSHS